MATISSIGTSSRNYSTVTAWKTAFASAGWEGESWNDSEFTGETFPITFNMATSATDYVILRCATGQSFKDNANSQSNALTYNQSNGVGIKNTTTYTDGIRVSSDYVTVQGIQYKCTRTSGGASGLCQITNTVTNSSFDGCLVDMDYTHSDAYLFKLNGGKIINCMGISRSGPAQGVFAGVASTISGTTWVRTSNNSASGTAIVCSSGAFTLTIINSSWWNYSAEHAATPTLAGSNNASNLAISFGSSNQASKTFTNQFVTTTSANSDFRCKAGADLIDNGTTDTTDIPAAIDIVGTARPQGSAWDIGCWEFVQTAAALVWQQLVQTNQPQNNPLIAVAT